MPTHNLIRPLLTIAEFHDCESLQHLVWGMVDDLETVPLHVLLTVARQGGILLGAFDGADLIGFVFGFPGFTPGGQFKHCSHMMGVHPDYQSRGIGRQLKLAQRAAVLEQGLDLITWTYDPLESRNAYLNIARLGAVSRTYIVDLYGPVDDGLNAGLPTDRLHVDWWLDSPWVKQRLGGEKDTPVSGPFVEAHRAGWSADRFRAPGELCLGPTNAAAVTFEVPADYQAIKAADPALALDWRLAAREVFQAYFGQGYTVTDFASFKKDGLRRSFYTLRRTSPVEPASSVASG
jgi:predicted GNAT superfamily acetyltransferase